MGNKIYKISEIHQGLTGSSTYCFSIEENNLVHISKYAIRKRKTNYVIEYFLNLEMLRGKHIIEIRCSNKAGLYHDMYVYPAEDLPKYWSDRGKSEKSLSYLNNYQLSYLSKKEQDFLNNDWMNYYIPLIHGIKSLCKKLTGKDVSDVVFPNLVEKQIKYELKFPITFLIPYSDKERKKTLGLKRLTKDLHQIWIAMLLIDALTRITIIKEIHLCFLQDSNNSIASWYFKDTIYSLWYESTPYNKMILEKSEKLSKELRLNRSPSRPDIVVFEELEKREDLTKDLEVLIIIECKNLEYNKWSKDIETQIIPYKRIFEPKTFILASMKKVPDSARMKLDKEGIIVIDEVYPNGKGEKEIVEKVIKSLT